MAFMDKILPGKTIGILGGGQLGRMLCIEAAKLGYKTITYAPRKEESAPAEQVSSKTIYAEYEDHESLKNFANQCDVITFEFENIPAETIKICESIAVTHPSSQAIYIAQNRNRERSFLKDNGLPSHKFKYISSAEEATEFLNSNGLEKAVIKSADFGYDGKGQVRITRGDNVEDKWQKSGFDNAVIEEFVKFQKEISVIIARKKTGEISVFPIGENIHENGILKRSIIPANINEIIRQDAIEIAEKIALKLEYVGVMGAELFVLENGKLYVNEIAPRVHNSGHWSLDGCATNQFEQHIRAICGLEFGDTKILCKEIIMENIIGSDMNNIEKYYDQPNCKIHHYNKSEIKEGRKLAHVNILK